MWLFDVALISANFGEFSQQDQIQKLIHLPFLWIMFEQNFCSNSKAHSCARVPVKFPADSFHAANEKVAEKSAELHKDLFCLEILVLCG